MPEMPILDGSTLKWYELFNEAGIGGNPDNTAINILSLFNYSENNTNIAVLPAEEFKITYCVNFLSS